MELEITSQNFEEIKKQGQPVLIDFWATWCGPCKRLGPIIGEIAAEYDGKAIIGKCDIEENDELTEQFGSPANLSQSSTWRTASGIFRIETPATYNLVFAWANDASVGTQPPTAIDNVVLVHNTCPSPIVSSGLVTSDSIVLVWQPGGNETSWVVTGNSDTMLVTDTFYVFDNLSPNQNYRFTVTALCDGGDSSAASAINIRTACGPMSVPFRESFDDSRWSTSTADPLPSCWYKNTNYSSNYPYASTSYNHSAGGSKSMYMYSSNASWTYMVLPLFAPALDSLQVSFWLYKSNTSYAHRLEVGVITNPTDPTSFRLIQSVVPTLSSTWEEFIVPLSGEAAASRSCWEMARDSYVSCSVICR